MGVCTPRRCRGAGGRLRAAGGVGAGRRRGGSCRTRGKAAASGCVRGPAARPGSRRPCRSGRTRRTAGRRAAAGGSAETWGTRRPCRTARTRRAWSRGAQPSSGDPGPRWTRRPCRTRGTRRASACGSPEGGPGTTRDSRRAARSTRTAPTLGLPPAGSQLPEPEKGAPAWPGAQESSDRRPHALGHSLLASRLQAPVRFPPRTRRCQERVSALGHGLGGVCLDRGMSYSCPGSQFAEAESTGAQG